MYFCWRTKCRPETRRWSWTSDRTTKRRLVTMMTTTTTMTMWKRWWVAREGAWGDAWTHWRRRCVAAEWAFCGCWCRCWSRRHSCSDCSRSRPGACSSTRSTCTRCVCLWWPFVVVVVVVLSWVVRTGRTRTDVWLNRRCALLLLWVCGGGRVPCVCLFVSLIVVVVVVCWFSANRENWTHRIKVSSLCCELSNWTTK